MSIDWTNPFAQVSKHFICREALWLPKWGRLATEADGLDRDAQNALVKFFEQMDDVRDFIGRRIDVHVAFRPLRYNVEVNGAHNSYHMARGVPLKDGTVKLCAAVDFDAFQVEDSTLSESCDMLRAALDPKLEGWGMRMERKPGSDWIHLDNGPVFPGGSRYFFP